MQFLLFLIYNTVYVVYVEFHRSFIVSKTIDKPYERSVIGLRGLVNTTGCSHNPNLYQKLLRRHRSPLIDQVAGAPILTRVV